ncbi:MAG: T9SS type A sorting domain-containing protein [Flavobacteriaceae bacterium]|nr:T9SS type A sorting domain-containing protein [Flavobacteriaceae bacterium]
MKKNFFLLMIIFTSTLSAQVVNIADGNSITVSAGATLDISGLELTPDADYSIVGENSVTKESTVVTIDGNESMSKNYTTGVSLEGYTGDVVFNYSDEEMNGVTHTASLYVMNSDSEWIQYEDEDSADYTISYSFTDPTQMKAITAGVQAGLSTIETQIPTIRIYPNPSSSIVNIDHTEDLEIILFNILGQQILKTNSKIIDISALNNGTYFLVAKDSNNTITNFKLIKK